MLRNKPKKKQQSQNSPKNAHIQQTKTKEEGLLRWLCNPSPEEIQAGDCMSSKTASSTVSSRQAWDTETLPKSSTNYTDLLCVK